MANTVQNARDPRPTVCGAFEAAKENQTSRFTARPSIRCARAGRKPEMPFRQHPDHDDHGPPAGRSARNNCPLPGWSMADFTTASTAAGRRAVPRNTSRATDHHRDKGFHDEGFAPHGRHQCHGGRGKAPRRGPARPGSAGEGQAVDQSAYRRRAPRPMCGTWDGGARAQHPEARPVETAYKDRRARRARGAEQHQTIDRNRSKWPT